MINITEKRDIVFLANLALKRGYSKEEFIKTPYMLGNEGYIDIIWNLVLQAKFRGSDTVDDVTGVNK